jgi:hypothetical protein
MSTDYAAKEREFLDSLEADTGRDLAGWMRAIDDSGMPTRNDIIDWLRLQGFLFARASWLERIHNNGGRPLYGEKPGKAQVLPSGRRQRAPEAAKARTQPREQAVADTPPAAAAAPPPMPAQAATPPAVAPPAAAEPGTVEELLARAKAYRPLAQYMLREIERAAPGTALVTADGLILACRPLAFAAVLTSARDIRLALDLGDYPVPSFLTAAKIAGLEPRFRHMLVLTDARQLNGDLAQLLLAADANVNGLRKAASG